MWIYPNYVAYGGGRVNFVFCFTVIVIRYHLKSFRFITDGFYMLLLQKNSIQRAFMACRMLSNDDSMRFSG